MNLFKSSIIKYIALLCFILLVTAQLRAQSFNSNVPTSSSPWSLNVSGGTSIFFGDIKQYDYIPVSDYENEWRFGGGLQFGYQVSPVLGLRLQGLYGKLAGTRRPSNLFFESNYIEINANADISIRNIVSGFDERRMWDVYFILGVGITNYNTEVMELNTKKIIRKLGYGNGVGFGGRTMEGVLIGGLGLKIRLTNNWSLNMESAHRGMNSDLLDGREGGFKYDIYNYTSLGLTYRFGKKRQQQNQNRQKEEDFDFFKNRKGSERETSANDQPVQPAEIDMLFVAPPILSKPVAPPKEEKPTIVVVEEVVEKPQVITPVVPEIEYRVQIRAKYGNAISIQKLSAQYNLPASQIKQNTYNGFYIYTIGSYPNYESARQKRNELRNNNGVVDAFVVAFKNGQRLNKLP